MVRVKICGHTREADVEASVAAGADAVGVIVDVPVRTPREVSVSRGADLLDSVPPFVTGVLVTMQDHVEDVVDLIEAVKPDAVQIHGGLTVSQVHDLVSRIQIPVIAVTDVDSPSEIDAMAAVANAVLLDSRNSDGGGGTGRTHDWSRAREVRRQIQSPLILAGGLTPENVEVAIENVGPYAVDVATGVEATGGQKDHRAIQTFLSRVQHPGVQVKS